MKRNNEDELEQTAGEERRAKRSKAGGSEEEETQVKAPAAPVHETSTRDLDATEQLKQCSLLDVVHFQKKLFLVLDLDHTLLNSTRFAKVDPDEALRISSLFDSAHITDNNFDIHSFPDFHLFTKLRPFVHEFLCQASTMFEMYVYTMGSRAYANAMVRLLDPSRCLFGNRIISCDDNNRSKSKSLDFILAPASATVILDDSHQVWHGFLANLIQIDRYHFFNSSSKQFGIQTPSLLGALKDESDASGTLAHTLGLLRAVHHAFFGGAPSAQAEDDVRHILHGFRSNLLTGCKIVFSKVFPIMDASFDPKAHPLWRLAEYLGAVCSTTLDDSVTHVVAYHAGTEEAKWACHHNCQLVHPRWIKATYFTWTRPNESDYAVDATPMLSTFSETTSLLQDNVCNTGLSAPTRHQSYVVGATVQCCG